MPTDSGSLLVVGGIAVASFIGAFGVSLGIAKRRSPEAFSRNVARDQVNPARLAMRALGLGTVLAIVGVSGLALAVKYTLGIKSVSEFGDKIQKLVPDNARLSDKRNSDKTD